MPLFVPEHKGQNELFSVNLRLQFSRLLPTRACCGPANVLLSKFILSVQFHPRSQPTQGKSVWLREVVREVALSKKESFGLFGSELTSPDNLNVNSVRFDCALLKARACCLRLSGTDGLLR